jgi:peptidyl-prolyl cis-trans isomerase B (cyclophilin B)
MRRLLTVAISLSLLAAAIAAHADAMMRVVVEGKGSFTVQLYTDKAPKTTAHIMKLARSGFYDGQRFHIAIHSPRPYRIQVGDPSSKSGDLDSAGSGGSGDSVPYEETGMPNVAGAVGLSTIPGNKNSGDSQFYVLLGPARFLDGSYTVFGKVVDGLDVVNKIEKGDRIQRVTISDR